MQDHRRGWAWIDGKAYVNPRTAKTRKAIMAARSVSIYNAVGPAWARALAFAPRLWALKLTGQNVRFLNEIGLVMPSLPALLHVGHTVYPGLLRSIKEMIDVSGFFLGCNACRGLRTVSLTYAHSVFTSVALTPRSLPRIQVVQPATGHSRRFWASFAGSHVRLRMPRRAQIDNSTDRHMVLAMREHPPASLLLLFDDEAAGRRAAVHHFLDFPADVKFRSFHDSVERAAREEDEFQNLRAVFAFATADTGPVGRFRERDGDCRLLAQLREFLM